MSKQKEKYTRRLLRSSYISVVVSISLVLFMLGMLGILLLNAHSIAAQVRENFSFHLMLHNDAREVDVREFQKTLEIADYVKSTEYISKEEAARELEKELEEDFLDFLGTNPLLNSIDIHLRADYVETQKIQLIEKELADHPAVKEVVYDKPLIQKMNENIERIGIILLAGSVILLLVAIALINSSIRLAIYSKRFLIRTMQMVGATKTFIRRPFLHKSLLHGTIGGLLAAAALGAILYYGGQYYPDFAAMQDEMQLIALFLGILLLGLFISWICTYFALRKYLKLKTDELYY